VTLIGQTVDLFSPRQPARLPSAALRFPFTLCPRIPDRLPLHVRGRIWTTAGKRDDVVLDVTGTGAACATGCRARVAQLELALDQG
jgi:hypothetical protein